MVGTTDGIYSRSSFWELVLFLLLTGLTVIVLVVERHREIFKKMAITDPLTGLLNRKGFDEQLKKMIQDDHCIHCVGAQMDIDDFKFINDMYGHVVGDAALKSLAQDMKDNFWCKCHSMQKWRR